MKDEHNRSLRHLNRKAEDKDRSTIEVDSSAFFSETPSSHTPPPRSSSSGSGSGAALPPPSWALCCWYCRQY